MSKDFQDPEFVSEAEAEIITRILVGTTLGEWRAPSLRVDWVGHIVRFTQEIEPALSKAFKNLANAAAKPSAQINALIAEADKVAESRNPRRRFHRD